VRHEISGDAPINAIALVQSAPVDRAEVYAQEPAEGYTGEVQERDRSERILLWIEVERCRTIDGPGLALRVAPSPSTDSRDVRFTVEELTHRARLITGPRTLPCTGHRVTRPANRLRLAIEWWR
jgi:hypothetical protein